MRVLRIGLCAVVAAVVLGCRTRETDLELPVYVKDYESGMCGTITALDGKGDLWSEHGCEGSSGFQFVRTVSQEEQARIVDAFAAHPDPASFSDPNCDGGYHAESHRFTERLSDGTKNDWRLCVDQSGLLPDPFDKTESAFSAAARR